MKNRILLFLVIGATIFFFACSEDNMLTPADSIQPDQVDQVESSLKGAKKPAANLIGIVEAVFTPTPPTVWNGTVDFGDLGIYSITFISHGPSRDYSQAKLFEEDIVIYELGTDWTVPSNVVMKGWNSGVLTLANRVPDPTKFHTNGRVDEAFGPLAMWSGCNLHIKGLVYWTDFGPPEKAISTIKIN